MSEEKEQSRLEQFIEHQKRAVEEAGKALEALFPPEFKEHSKAAVNESMEGFKVLFSFEADDSDEADSSTGKKKVKIEVG